MWISIARIILRNRIALLIAIGLFTVFLAWKGKDAKMSYEYAQMLPDSDTTNLEHDYFKDIFGEGANVFVIGLKDPDFFQVDKFNDWQSLGNRIENVYGITEVLSVGKAVNIKAKHSSKEFITRKVFPDTVHSQYELDSLAEVLQNLPFYKNLLYTDSTHTYLMAISLGNEVLNTKKRLDVVDTIHYISKRFAEKYNVSLEYSGLPYVRTEVSKKIKAELAMFMVLAFIVTAIILYLFFRSFKVVFFSLLVVAIGAVWSFGLLKLFNFEITILTGMIPPLLIVIGVPNSIFLLNKYHAEYKKHGNKIKALQRVIHKVGNAIFLTNLTTASGFATFILTSSNILVEFGILASINILGVFLLAITMIPIIFSFLPPPRRKHVKHLDNKLVNRFVEKLVTIVDHHRPKVYYTTAIVLFVIGIGITQMHTTGYMIDDIPHDDPMYRDLVFFQEELGGVIPFEIMIDTREKNGVFDLETLKRIDTLQTRLKSYHEFSKSMSVADAAKFLRQAYRGGSEKRYKLPVERERVRIARYLESASQSDSLLHNFVDTARQITRISMNVKDIGTKGMEKLKADVRNEVDAIFSPEQYDVIITGSSIIYSKGTRYLIRNLFVSLAIAIVLIGIFMSFMFYSWRMVVISLIPNFIPLLLTAAIMGYFGIPIKVSTILIFSIAFGISVDDTIHFLAKYRQELSLHDWNISKAVKAAIRETGVSMMYTSIVLFFGFSIFSASEFGGTQALGILVSLTLLFAMFSNLIILPTLLMTLEKMITTRDFREPFIHYYEEDEEIELDNLKIDGRQISEKDVK
jgi:predicted RND superfamily exporter protein